MIQPIKNLLLVCVLCVVLAGCAKDRAFGLSPSIEVTQLTELPAPKTTADYVIGSQETLEIVVTDVELLSGTFLTDAQGYISYPLVGDVYLANKTPRQAEVLIANSLRGEYVVDPQVRIRPSALVAPTISMGGQVTRPGDYPANANSSLLRAVNNAGGLQEYAKVDDVLVMRTVDGQRFIGVFNIEAIQRGNYSDPKLYPNDVVTVGDSPGRRQLDNILQYVPLLSTTVILFDRVTN